MSTIGQSPNPCRGLACPNGNCIGCRDGHIWCQDPRCSPHCRGCETPRHTTLFTIALFIIIIVGVIAICAIIMVYWKSTHPATLHPIYPLPSQSQVAPSIASTTGIPAPYIPPPAPLLPITQPAVRGVTLTPTAPPPSLIRGSLSF